MVVLLVLLALAMIATGSAAIAFGVPIVQIERGWTMVISGTIVSSAGLLLLGVALAAARLSRIANELTLIRDRVSSLDVLLDERVAAGPPPAAEPGPPPPPPPDLAPIASPEPAAPSARPASEVVVGQYASGGNSYVMFEDGSIQADTPHGRRRFASLDELRAFVAAGGEQRPDA